jgi:uncharacterized membrane protein (Fun14 family)
MVEWKTIMNQALWNDKDLAVGVIVGVGIGFVVGLAFGYEWAWRPVVNCIRPLIG